MPLVILVSAANRHDSMMFEQCVDAIPATARRGTERGERLGKHRWIVERTHGWFADFGKLRIRFERHLDIHEALLKLAAAIICARFVDRSC